ncbi:MAG: ExeM/NucH family extracellular endonuclease [Chloroflexi bacterium]|nr:MAG: ExeM/NucH family extracellular endonuclease [Chloroflexota bacterium]
MRHKKYLLALALISAFALLLGMRAPTYAATTVFINEIHYDNSGTDTGEAIEIAGPAGTDLTGWSLVLYNGSTGLTYSTTTLNGTIPNQQNGFGTVSISYPTNGIQNGAPDGIALVDATNTVVQFLSYEGTFTAGDGPAAGMTSMDIGVSESSSTAAGDSLQLTGTGSTYEDFTWASAMPNTFGAVNTGQTFGSTAPPAVSISEIRIDQPGTDNDEYFELTGDPGTSLDGLTYLVIGDGTGGSGVIEAVVDLTGNTIPASGFFVAAESTFTLGTADLVTNLNFENSDNVTHLLVTGFSGADGDDLDIDDDGTLDTTPWTDIIDLIALIEEENPPTGTEFHYGPPSVGPDGSFVPGHAFLCDSGWQIGEFDPAAGDDTPGAANACPTGPAQVLINEIRIDQSGTDNDEYFELAGNPGASLDGLTYLVIGDGAGGSGVIEAVVDLTGNAIPTDGLFVAAESTFTLGTADFITNLNFENSDNVTHLLVADFTGADGDDLDIDDDGTLDTTPWSNLVDCVALVETPGSGDQIYCSQTVGPDGSFVPGHVYLCEDGWRIGAFSGGNDTPGDPNPCETGPAFGACGDPATFIHDVQGNGFTSPLNGTSGVVIEGVVVGDFQDTANQLGGFFIQEEDSDADADPQTSEGLFVFDNGFGPDVNVGDVVRVQGSVTEFFDMTEINSVTNLAVCSSGATVTPATITLPLPSVGDFEFTEGMLVTINQTLYVTGNFNQGRFGEVDLSVNGRLFTPTHLVAPGAAANALQDLNDRSRILLDDGSTIQNPLPLPPYLGPDNTLRAGDTTTGLTGVLGFSFGSYRIHPTQPVSFTRVNARENTPPPVNGRLTIASFNVLNYFTTIDTGAPICGPNGNLGCRGADSVDEFMRQRAKIISALSAMNADVVGLNELENNDHEAIADLVSGLNDALGAGTYAYIDTGTIGEDAIKVGLIYKPASVTPVGPFAILDSSVDPLFLDTKNRPALAQTFMENATGAKFTVVVNHLKSKGSPCDDVGDPNLGDGQGNCNLTRTNAATALVNWLATDPTGSGDPDFLIMGDLNAYAMEDPITAIKNAGYTDLINAFLGPNAYSFVFFGQAGYLDHALANSSLTPQVAGVAEWHINADEPRALDYNDFNQPLLYNPDPFRSSDHDPVLIGVDLNAPPDCSTAVPSRASLWPPNRKLVRIEIQNVIDPDGDPVTITIDSIFQDEPVSGPGFGKTAPDGVGVGKSMAWVRAERAGSGNGRVYHIAFTADDGNGNSCSGEVTVEVPHSFRGTAVDDGAIYDSTTGPTRPLRR